MPSKRYKNRAKTDPCTELEAADFKSGVGDLHLVTSKTRVDHAVDTSRFQKRQAKPNYGDYLDLARVVKEVKQTADFSLRITKIEKPVLGAWADSALYGSEADLLEYDSDAALEG